VCAPKVWKAPTYKVWKLNLALICDHVLNYDLCVES
jgi:hypothetical protein